MKKVFVILSMIIGICFIIANTNIVRAENTEGVKILQQNIEINDKMLEDIRTSRFNTLIMPTVKIQANPEQEDITKYYYKQLENQISRNTYNTLETEINNKVTINLEEYEYSISDPTEEKAMIGFQEILLPYVMDGYEAYIMDSSANYWWTSDVKIGNVQVIILEDKVKFKSVEIWSNMQEWEERNNFKLRLEELSDSITGNSVYEIVKAINYYIINNVEYTIIDDTDIEQTAYGALILNKAVCEGQTQLFNLICREKGIYSLNVYGYTNQNSTSTAHAWNYVYEPTRKQWYAIDVTWNNYYQDPIYLMVGTNTDANGVQFGKNHIAGFKQYTVQTYIPSTPVLATERYISPIALEEDYMVNIQPNMSYDSFVKEFSNEINFTVKEDERVLETTDLIKTGQKFIMGGNIFTLIVTGDVNSDGLADIKDILQINKHRLNKVKLTEEFLKSANINKDENVDIKDILQINKYRLGKIKEF